AGWAFCRAVPSVKGGSGGRGDTGPPPPHHNDRHQCRTLSSTVTGAAPVPPAPAPAPQLAPGQRSCGRPGLLDGELGRRIRLEAILGDRQGAADRAPALPAARPLP